MSNATTITAPTCEACGITRAELLALADWMGIGPDPICCEVGGLR